MTMALSLSPALQSVNINVKGSFGWKTNFNNFEAFANLIENSKTLTNLHVDFSNNILHA